ncbi:MAG: hypothetical protein K2P94_10420 [Rhodospirillaceae bacterium]|nr:hypothetical protein [Rhodospirillaceae bacterium]
MFGLVTNWKFSADKADADRWAEVYADLASFVRGEIVALPRNPPRNKRARFAPLMAPESEIWEYRHQSKKHRTIRIFGRFASKDCFAGLIWRYRGDLPENDDWKQEKKETAREWQKLFEPLKGVLRNEHKNPPYPEGYYDEYVSNYVLV